MCSVCGLVPSCLLCIFMVLVEVCSVCGLVPSCLLCIFIGLVGACSGALMPVVYIYGLGGGVFCLVWCPHACCVYLWDWW